MRHSRRPWERWLVATGLAAAAASVLSAAQAPAPPKVLAELLRAQPDWQLLDPTIDLVGEYTIKQLEELDRWPPWLEQDFDKDGYDDVAAVVVRRAAGRATEFAVVVAQPGRFEFVVPFAAPHIVGVSEGIADDTIMPLRCADCETNVWYRWNGRAFEAYLQVPGEFALLSGGPAKPSPIYADARPDAARLTEVPSCVRAKVQEVAGDEGKRWYRVEVIAPGLPRGWVPQQFVVQRADCLN
jgi:hypothetical protein